MNEERIEEVTTEKTADIYEVLNQTGGAQISFDQIRLSIASPETIRSRSFGEIKRPETINYRTLKPERDGLFCMRIFGPVRDFECGCGKYKRIKYKGIVCEKCGVEVTHSRVRRERMGHIELAAPVAHIWFAKSVPSRIGTLLDIPTKDLERILCFEAYVVTDPGLTTLQRGQLFSEEAYCDAQDEHGEDSFTAMMGAAALKVLLSQLDLPAQKEDILSSLETVSSELRRKKLIKRLKLVQGFLKSKARPEWMIMDVIPVIPPELRPLVPLDGGRFATADLNDLYRRLVNRNNRLKRLYELKAPSIIVRNEERMLQEIADALFDNSRRGRPVVGANKRPLKSISDTLRGKQGRFRQNLLGKRVDYSGRSVIVVGPHLKLNQCGLPKKMALELFRPFVCHRLEKYGLVPTLKAAKRFVEKARPEVWGILEEVVKDHPVLLNRAPTLHRLGIQAFEPLLIEDQAIQVHPLVCKAFNADFDGDTMSVHVPLSVEAQLEARLLMMSTNNILSPADGSPMIVPSKDMVLGLYYLTLADKRPEGNLPAFSSTEEVRLALFHKAIQKHSWVRVLINDVLPNGDICERLVETTPGRLFIWEHVSPKACIAFDAVNKPLTSGDVATLIETTYTAVGSEDTVTFADSLLRLGFEHSTLSGVSFGKDDLLVPENKDNFVKEAWGNVHELRQQYMEGLITQNERHNAVTDVWEDCTEKVVGAMIKKMSQDKEPAAMNAIYMMAHSGARGSVAQMRQLAGMRGLIAKHSGDILEHPITSNFSEGLKAFEYFSSTHGSRKGLSDMALKTANSGYLTRRLVDVAQDCIVTEEDCGTQEGLDVTAVTEGGEEITPLSAKIVGRCLAEAITDESGKELLPKGYLIETKDWPIIQKLGLLSVKIRSVLMCQAKRGLCAKCYGTDLARGRMVSLGEAVGVVAAQSIGEPGTQLTLRTFHLGGAAQKASKDSTLTALQTGAVRLFNVKKVQNSDNVPVALGRSMQLEIAGDDGLVTPRQDIPYGAQLYVNDGARVEKGFKIAEWNPYHLPIATEVDGHAYFADLVEGVSCRTVTDEATGMLRRVVLDWRQNPRGKDLKPRFVLRDAKGKPVVLENGLEARYFLSVDAQLVVEDGAAVKTGDTLAQLPRESSKIRDITGGLPRIAELVEARIPKDPSVINEIEGVVSLGRDYKAKRAIIVTPAEGEPVEYMVARGKHVLVQEGDTVKKGDVLVDGSPVLKDVLRILGVGALAAYLIKEIQAVYQFQGVTIADKHIEIVVRQMLQKVEITEPGGTLYLVGDQVDRLEFQATNEEMAAQGRQPATAMPVLQGITKASLQTSFISAASFQDAPRVLTDAALQGATDSLSGLKESVISGRLIPAGTGWVEKKLREEAAQLTTDNAPEDVNLAPAG